MSFPGFLLLVTILYRLLACSNSSKNRLRGSLAQTTTDNTHDRNQLRSITVRTYNNDARNWNYLLCFCHIHADPVIPCINRGAPIQTDSSHLTFAPSGTARAPYEKTTNYRCSQRLLASSAVRINHRTLINRVVHRSLRVENCGSVMANVRPSGRLTGAPHMIGNSALISVLCLLQNQYAAQYYYWRTTLCVFLLVRAFVFVISKRPSRVLKKSIWRNAWPLC